MKNDYEELDEPRRSWQAYLPMLVRRRWYIAAPMFLFGFLSFVADRVWPYLYKSEALVMVEQQKISETYVTSNVIQGLEERLDQMTQKLLSRTSLRLLIDRFHLYPRERAYAPMEDIIDDMRAHTKVELVQTPGRAGVLTAFRIRYLYRDPKMAQRITSELTTMFIEENLRARTQQSMGTTNFFEAELEQAQKELTSQEERLRAYKLRYIGELPEQLSANLQMLSSQVTQLHAANAALDRAEQQKVYLESLRNEYRMLQKSASMAISQLSPSSLPGAPRRTSENPAVTLAEMRQQLAELSALNSPDHPDVKRLKRQIAGMEAVVSKANAGAGGTSTTVIAGVPASRTALDPGLIETESRLKALTVEIETEKKNTEKIRRQVEDLQRRLSVTPVREQQLAEVTRNYENSRANYQSLLQKKRLSELATNLETRQKGEQLRILDAASMPKRPEEPTREEVVLFGWGAGFCVGIALAALREFTDRRIRTESDLYAVGDHPVLTSIPNVLLEPERVVQLRTRAVEFGLAALLITASVGTGIRIWMT